jgi:uncharacterized protein YbgA (DUF1722 family)/uncharacterized protein YbbK (DUF523 family)
MFCQLLLKASQELRQEETCVRKRIRLGISTCLLGKPVRYDGGHSLDRFLTDTFGKYVEYVPVCPEAECGLGVPRESMRLVGDPDAPLLMTSHTGRDYTELMLKWALKRIAELEHVDLCGFIFKSRSPSSGMEQVKVYNAKGVPVRKGVGIFARAFMENFPLLPVEDDGRLYDPGLRDNFIERVFALKRWRDILAKRKSRGSLVDFHTKHRLLILSHSQKHYQVTGRLVAKAKDIPIRDLYEKYQHLLMDALRLRTTVKKNVNVLQHMMGYLKKELSSDEKQELLEIIDEYHQGCVPLIVPITLMNHYARKYDQPYLKDQFYLHPHPVELQLRNHV